MKKNEAHPESISGRLATYLTEQKDAIIKAWVAQVRKDSTVPTDTMAMLEIVEHVPAIFDVSHISAEFAPRQADWKFDDDSSASAIGIFHDNVRVAVGGLFCLTVC